MEISQKGVDLIKTFEGCRLKAYDDATEQVVNENDVVKGTLTIGYGHTENVYKGEVITPEQAESLLKSDLNIYSGYVQAAINNKTISFDVNQNMFDALTSFTYNCGQGNLQKLCSGRSSAEVAEHMLLYVNKGTVWENGLTKRRIAEHDLFLTPIVNPTPKPVEPNYQTYTIRKGDTLSSIARKFNTGVNVLASLNNIANVNKIYVGQVIKISQIREYVVKSGDTLTGISYRIGCSIKWLCDKNGISNPNVINVGQVLKY